MAALGNDVRLQTLAPRIFHQPVQVPIPDQQHCGVGVWARRCPAVLGIPQQKPVPYAP